MPHCYQHLEVCRQIQLLSTGGREKHLFLIQGLQNHALHFRSRKHSQSISLIVSNRMRGLYQAGPSDARATPPEAHAL